MSDGTSPCAPASISSRPPSARADAASPSITHSAGGASGASATWAAGAGVPATPELRNWIITLSAPPGSPSQTMSPSFSGC